ncbi:MAG TPA: 16S rRNA (guanine(527)-N(7))-methyltransferase RsmG [Fimbriimonadaceae bacterium]|nr:16S rRNA (guanine(527)-N(7))-methyltransferase RsmG [Fimbriimonadaceae bacterium]
MNREAFAGECERIGLPLTGLQLDRFQEFEENLYKWNEVMNLTRVPKGECWVRHFLDSLLIQEMIPKGASVLDIGTGPGFPAWPLACAKPDLQVVAIDSSGKMIGFLDNNPLENLKTLKVRAEEWGMRDAFDVVTGRAIAPLGIQLEISAPLCKFGGVILPMRTPSEREAVDKDVSDLGLRLENVVEKALPGTEIVRLFPVYRKVAKTPERYPRPWAEIRRRPII